MKLPAEEVEEAQLGLAPLLDVVLLLLIFFIVTTSFTKPRIDLDLPEAFSGEIGETPQLTVSIDAGGGIELDGEPITIAGLGPALDAGLEHAEDAELLVRADSAVTHGQVVEVLDLARTRGIQSVGIEVAAGANAEAALAP